jgi:hypothetical protein|tara:strand:- start:422 stop:925 length:504 start_codon:yes stop_codon:yes gene_type:complete
MALKGDRYEGATDISFFATAAVVRGRIMSYSTSGSGVALDQGDAVCAASASASGQVPLGLLLNDVVNIDQTRQHINFHKNEVQKGGKVTLLTNGWVVTNDVTAVGTITAGSPAYMGANGKLTDSQSATGGAAANPPVGEFMSKADEDSYYKVRINLPQRVPGVGTVA